MKTLSIHINGTLRDVLTKLKVVYQKYTSKDAPEEIKDLDLLKYFDFKDEEELLSFMYEECPMEIFGHGRVLTENSFVKLNEFYKTYRDVFKIKLVSDEVEKSKPATLFFLAKYGCLIDTVEFYGLGKEKEMWKNTDIFVSADSIVLDSKPKNKKTIKISNEYNEKSKGDFTIETINELNELDLKEKL
tara:strand:- start:2218 stop:2781 length:564 start_codon:yes stop_codon:yes gene_type:complete